MERFYITGLGKQKIIFGYPWLQKHNPIINWKTGEILWENEDANRSSCQEKSVTLATIYEQTVGQENIWINAKTNTAMELAIEENIKKADLPAKELIHRECLYENVGEDKARSRAPRGKDECCWRGSMSHLSQPRSGKDLIFNLHSFFVSTKIR